MKELAEDQLQRHVHLLPGDKLDQHCNLKTVQSVSIFKALLRGVYGEDKLLTYQEFLSSATASYSQYPEHMWGNGQKVLI